MTRPLLAEWHPATARERDCPPTTKIPKPPLQPLWTPWGEMPRAREMASVVEREGRLLVTSVVAGSKRSWMLQ